MVPESFAAFFLAAASAGAAFIGLLFVAISIRPRRTFGAVGGPHPSHQHLAEVTLLTLANGFLVSSIALIPGANAGWAALALGLGGMAAAAGIVRSIARSHRHGPSRTARLRHLLHVECLSLAVTALHVAEGVCGLRLVIRPADPGPVRWLALVVVGLFVLATVRAWTLLGDPRGGWSGWLNPLHDPRPSTAGTSHASFEIAVPRRAQHPRVPTIPSRTSVPPGVGLAGRDRGGFTPEAPGGWVHHRWR